MLRGLKHTKISILCSNCSKLDSELLTEHVITVLARKSQIVCHFSSYSSGMNIVIHPCLGMECIIWGQPPKTSHFKWKSKVLHAQFPAKMSYEAVLKIVVTKVKDSNTSSCFEAVKPIKYGLNDVRFIWNMYSVTLRSRHSDMLPQWWKACFSVNCVTDPYLILYVIAVRNSTNITVVYDK